MSTRTIAIKRLSAVEINPDASNQREFHADKFHRELGFEGDKVTGPLLAIYQPREGEAVVDDTTYTLYQARKPPRSEYRLYPLTRLFLDRAREGDLMVVFRTSVTGLRIVVAETGSRAEQGMLDAFFARDVPSLESFTYVAPGAGTSSASNIGEALTLPFAVDRDDLILHDRTYLSAVEHGVYPTTSEMAETARRIVGESLGAGLDPDAFLWESLSAETNMFFAIEREIAGADLKKLVAGNPDVTAVLDWSTRRLNSRKSRRGHSLQRQFEALLTREGIPFQAEAKLEAPPPADIIVPSAASYADATFPADRLRLVSCKSTLKERWMEVVPEASRIQTKYLLTLDDRISDNVIRALRAAEVAPYMPRQVIDAAYASRPTRSLLGTVADLIRELDAIAQ